MLVLAETVDEVEEDQHHVGCVALVNHLHSHILLKYFMAELLHLIVPLDAKQPFEAYEVH